MLIGLLRKREEEILEQLDALRKLIDIYEQYPHLVPDNGSAAAAPHKPTEPRTRNPQPATPDPESQPTEPRVQSPEPVTEPPPTPEVPETLFQKPEVENLSYYKENEGDPGTKTFRDLKTHVWYYEKQLVEIFDAETVEKIKVPATSNPQPEPAPSAPEIPQGTLIPMPFRDAREFAHSLGLTKSGEWSEYCQGKFPELPKKPDNIPGAVNVAYADQGFTTFPDFLGYDPELNKPKNQELGGGRKSVPYTEARAFTSTLGLKLMREWNKYVDGGYPDLPLRPAGIPNYPQIAYKRTGEWKTWGDFLGCDDQQSSTNSQQSKASTPPVPEVPNNGNQPAANNGSVRGVQADSYERSRAFAITLGLRSPGHWKRYVNGKYPDLPERPSGIPKHPYRAYHETPDWKGWGHFLGYEDLETSESQLSTDKKSQRGKESIPYQKAREFAITLGLKSAGEWTRYIKGEYPDLPSLPAGVPKFVYQTYLKKGDWESWGDFLGYDDPESSTVSLSGAEVKSQKPPAPESRNPQPEPIVPVADLSERKPIDMELEEGVEFITGDEKKNSLL